MPSQTLRIHCPTASTTSYTVTTRKIPRSALARIIHQLLLLARVLLAAACVGVLAVVLAERLRPAKSGWQKLGATGLDTRARTHRQTWEWRWGGQILESCVRNVGFVEEAFAARVGDGGAAWALVAVVAGCLWGLTRTGYVEESILALRSLGLQTSTSSPSIFSTPTTRFIPTAQIQDIFIYEAFIGFTVQFYLAVIVEGEEEAVVVFPKLLPRREVLEEVWRGLRRVLWGAGGKPTRTPMGSTVHANGITR